MKLILILLLAFPVFGARGMRNHSLVTECSSRGVRLAPAPLGKTSGTMRGGATSHKPYTVAGVSVDYITSYGVTAADKRAAARARCKDAEDALIAADNADGGTGSTTKPTD